jgi:hypothetical protein
MKSFHGLLLAAAVSLSAACSSTSTTPAATADSGPGSPADGGGGVDASTDGGFSFVFANGGTNIARTDFRVAPVSGSFCMGTSPKQCSFTGSITDTATGCTGILNAAFVGGLTVGAAFPIVADATTPEGKGDFTYTETCSNGVSKTWKATAGTLTLSAVTPPAQGLVTGTLSFSVTGATMAPAPVGAGNATGTFDASGTASHVGYTSPSG